MRPWATVLLCSVAAAACTVGVSRSATVTTAPPAPETVVSTTSTTAPPRTYVVARGDTLGAIAKRFGVSVQTLAASNHLTNQDVLAVGQVLRVPPAAPLALSVTPGTGPAGTSFQLRVSGVAPADTVTFGITPPGRSTYTGPQHPPAPDGTVAASYHTSTNDPTGTYTVVATAGSGASASAKFQVTPATVTSAAPPQ